MRLSLLEFIRIHCLLFLGRSCSLHKKVVFAEGLRLNVRLSGTVSWISHVLLMLFVSVANLMNATVQEICVLLCLEELVLLEQMMRLVTEI